MPLSHPSHDLLAAVLDAGDGLVAACAAGDLDAADEALALREGLMEQLLAAPRPEAMPQALVVRFRAQEARLQRELARGLDAAAQALGATRTAHAAHARYQATPAAPRLDTAPR